MLLAGRVTDLFSGQPVPGIRVVFGKNLRATTDLDGRFEIAGSPTTTLQPLTFEGPGIVARSTYATSSQNLWRVVPTGFDMARFHDLARELAGKTTPWVLNPRVVIDLRAHGFPAGPYIATWAEEATAQAYSFIRDWSGGRIVPASIAATLSPPADFTKGTIVIHFSERNTDFGGGPYIGWCRWRINSIAEMESAAVWIRAYKYRTSPGKRKGILGHELGHAMGYGHVSGGSFMDPSLGSKTALLTWDQLAAKLAYGRWPGNRLTDADAKYTGHQTWWTKTLAWFAQTEFEPQ